MNKQRKPGLTLKEHERIGKELIMMRNRLIELRMGLSNSYPKNKKTGAKHIRKVVEYLDCLRSDLENRLYEDRKGFGDVDKGKGWCCIYYPGREVKQT